MHGQHLNTPWHVVSEELKAVTQVETHYAKLMLADVERVPQTDIVALLGVASRQFIIRLV